MLRKIVLLSFVLFALIGLVPPWFVDFKAIDPKYSTLELALLLITGGACLILCRLADRERLNKSQQEGSHEEHA